MKHLLRKLSDYRGLVMFSHTLFSLPFALAAMIWAAEGIPPFRTFLWILLALFGARNGANALNRIIDRDIDAKNPRTAGRHIPAGKVKTAEAWAIVALCFSLYIFSAFMLNPLCALLSPLPLGIFWLYSYTKRFTPLCHLVLGIACGGAPVGAWLAVRAEFSLPALVLGGVVALWVAGFDILYAILDIDFDRQENLHSIPAWLGVNGARVVSALLHTGAFAGMAGLALLLPLGSWYHAGLIVCGVLLATEHLLARPGHFRGIRIASYGLNQLLSLAFMGFTLLDFFIGEAG
ncbi:MAG TPA: 4-hydroxybenzoate octaprenyltransferase [Clostridiales bacterium]|nr:4-hydroxybenzoate octaprenyltransferase [Clostridiales bacterium]